MDGGIIQNFKTFYRQEVVRYLLQQLDEKKELIPLNVLEGMRYIRLAWNRVTGETIRKCFVHCGFQISSDTAEQKIDVVSRPPCDDIHLCDEEDWKRLVHHFGVPDLDFCMYVSVNTDVQVFAISSEEEIIQDVLKPDADEADEDDDE